ncbi:hypothetical protein BS47DRAFT_437459 [Hydnum rufescens UP504]|uniref:Uncharacterized protein n=1 Tax=Hydnum rufescens UP504 TaxID=1448309 RepID=A0A9P6AJB5_9AGAM|nr:hypothetical protein BS47DRAFT_437459 [Hydnum rufescens UP504]
MGCCPVIHKENSTSEERAARYLLGTFDPDSWNAEDRALSSSSNATATKLHAFSTANSMTALSCTSTQNSYTRGSHHRSYGADTLKSPYLRVSAGYLGTSAPIHRTMPASAADLYASASNVPNHPLEIQPRSSFQQHSRRGPRARTLPIYILPSNVPHFLFLFSPPHQEHIFHPVPLGGIRYMFWRLLQVEVESV